MHANLLNKERLDCGASDIRRCNSTAVFNLLRNPNVTVLNLILNRVVMLANFLIGKISSCESPPILTLRHNILYFSKTLNNNVFAHFVMTAVVILF